MRPLPVQAAGRGDPRAGRGAARPRWTVPSVDGGRFQPRGARARLFGGRAARDTPVELHGEGARMFDEAIATELRLSAARLADEVRRWREAARAGSAFGGAFGEEREPAIA